MVRPLSHLSLVAAEDVVALLKEGVHELFPDALPCTFGDTHGDSGFTRTRLTCNEDGSSCNLSFLDKIENDTRGSSGLFLSRSE